MEDEQRPRGLSLQVITSTQSETEIKRTSGSERASPIIEEEKQKLLRSAPRKLVESSHLELQHFEE